MLFIEPHIKYLKILQLKGSLYIYLKHSCGIALSAMQTNAVYVLHMHEYMISYVICI